MVSGRKEINNQILNMYEAFVQRYELNRDRASIVEILKFIKVLNSHG